MPARLPRYVFRRANGSFRYKRSVPKALQVLIGKETLYRQLGDSYYEAMQNLPLVHARIEALFKQETQKSSRQRSLELIRGALGDEVAELVLANAVPEYSPIEDGLNEFGKQLHRKGMPQAVVEQVYAGQLKPDVLSLAKALDEYAAYKADTPGAEKEIIRRIERLKADMVAVYGKPKLALVPLQEITRQDANELRDHLLARISPNSALRMLGVVRTAINHVITEHSLSIPNVFNKLKVKGSGASKDDRLPISEAQLEAVLQATCDNGLANTLLVVLADTGARLGEIVGLEAQDIELEAGIVHIRPNAVRRFPAPRKQRGTGSAGLRGNRVRNTRPRYQSQPVLW